MMKKLAMSALLGAVVLASANASATVINFGSLGLAEGPAVLISNPCKAVVGVGWRTKIGRLGL
jgi:hypothetical protein